MVNNKIKSGINSIAVAAILALCIVGTRCGNTAVGMIAIVAIVLWIMRCIVWNPGNKWLAISIWAISLGLLYQTSLSGNYLLGNDVHGEYYFANQILQSGRWDINISEEYNVAMGSAIIPASLSYGFGIPLEWVFKAVLPLFFSIVPVALFRMTTRQQWLSDIESFIGCIFFTSIPTVFTEISSIGKEMTAEALMMICLVFIVDRQVNIKAVLRYIMGGVMLTMSILCHYSTGIILCGYIGGTIIATLIKKSDVSPKWLSVILIISIVIGGSYYSLAGRGVVSQAVIGNSLSQIQLSIQGPVRVLEPENKTAITEETSKAATKESSNSTTAVATNSTVVKKPAIYRPTTLLESIVSKMERTTQAALALDFEQVPIEGKVFRILQIATEILLILGGAWALRYWRRIDSRYLGLMAGGWLILIVMLAVPGVSPILNATRFYHMALIGIWPCIILSTRWLKGKRERISTIIVGMIICSYLIFTSGFVFEAIKATYIHEPWIPYSYGLSNSRTDVGGVFSDNDDDVRDWIILGHESKIYSDQWGYVFLAEKVDEHRIHQLPWNLKEVPNDAYIFLRQYNNDKETWIYWWGVGLRKAKTYQESGMYQLLDGRQIEYQSGNAKYYGPKEVK